MSALKSGWWLFAGSLVAILALRTTTMSGQSAAGTIDTMSALLQEVHGLRVAMEEMASAGPRVQLALGRLQLQEQRVNNMIRRSDTVREAAAGQVKQLTEVADRVTHLQQALDNNTLPAAERTAVEQELSILKTQRARLTQEVQRLQAEEADAASQVANEQSRWVEINQRLEDLERSLVRK
jgi:predicted  nucleic acid-binding Zn-ribbon protein